MKCSKCQHENKEGSRFCKNCGSELELICPRCHHNNEPDAIFCNKCGTRLIESPESMSEIKVPRLEDMHSQLQSLIPDILAQKYMSAEQRASENRPITALFADISGFTPLSATKSSEVMFQLVQDCFKQLVSIVASYEGSISGFRGDGLLALFGAPIIHENDAERAILSAMDMRNTMRERQLEISVGINTAMMTVGEIQTELHKEYTAYGTDINLAKRLQEAAKPGQILVGYGTHRLTRRAFDFNELPSLEVKGFSQPVTAYVLQRVKSHPEKLRGIEGLRAKMVGRDREFEELIDITGEWLSGKGQIVSIIGEAGIGKSRLVSELKEYLREKDETSELHPSSLIPHPFLEGRCISIGQTISYWPFLDILRSWLNLSEDDTEAEITWKVRNHLESLFPGQADDILPFLGQLMNLKFGGEIDTRLIHYSPEQVKQGIMIRLRDIFSELSRHSKLMLILEDLHWADELSLDLIALLMDELISQPLMLVCVYRPEQGHNVSRLVSIAQRKCLDRYTKIELEKLSQSEGRRLVSELLAIDDLPNSVRDMILAKSEGNPFFIEEVIRSLMEQDLVYREDNCWKAKADVIEVQVPDTIQSVILERIDRLESEAKYVLQCASVIGRLFKYRLLDHITQKQKELDRYLDEFEERDLTYPERTFPEMEYAFKHALTQEATYQGILEQKRMAFHRSVAVSIERLYQERIEDFYEELAYHWERGKDKDKMLEYLIKTGQKSARNYLNDTAISYYTRAIELTKELGISGDRLAEIYDARSQVYFNIGFYEEAVDDMLFAISNYSGASKRANMYSLIIAIYNWCISDDQEVEKYISLALEEIRSPDKSREFVYACANIMATLGFKKPQMAEDVANMAIGIAEEMGYKDLLAYCYSILAWIYMYPLEIRDQRFIDVKEKVSSYMHYLKSSSLSIYATACAVLSTVTTGSERLNYVKEAVDASIKTGNVFANSACVDSFRLQYDEIIDADKIAEVYEPSWNFAVKSRWSFYGILSLAEFLIKYYMSKCDESSIVNMIDRLIDSTYNLHSRNRVHRNIKDRWNRQAESHYNLIRDLAPNVYSGLENLFRARIEESQSDGERFFYNCQLMYVVLLDGRIEDAKAYSMELARLYPDADSFAKNVSKRMEISIKLLNSQTNELPSVIRDFLYHIDKYEDLEDSLEAINWILSVEEISKAIDGDRINQIVLDYMKQRHKYEIPDIWIGIERLYNLYKLDEAFQSLINNIQSNTPDNIRDSGITQFSLEPYEFSKLWEPEYIERFMQDPVKSGWEWVDPSGDCEYIVKEGEYIELNTRLGHSLWEFSNYNAPRLMLNMDGDFIVETCVTDGARGRKYGGLLIWKDESSFIEFVIPIEDLWGNCIRFGANSHPFEADKFHLRLERKGDRFTGYVSRDSKSWYSCGWVDFPVEDPIKVGIYALCIHSSVTSTRSEYFKIRKKPLSANTPA